MNAVQCKLAHAREVKTYQETITKLQNEMKTLRMEMGRLNHDNISALHTISTNHQRMSPILKGIVANSSKALNGFRYHPETMVFAYDIQSHSASGYEILRNQIRFPLV